jgi:hypothetical protein
VASGFGGSGRSQKKGTRKEKAVEEEVEEESDLSDSERGSGGGE